ncbi:hypothetical protein [Bradyrhizobium sp.]|jgi:hypothetical protein|uniref:hypothetical protein n=1 Tax=Bradyrhizobium sp. TaxID=376 RepID=UPI003BAE67F7
MADEAFALSPISARAALPSEADYDAIKEAFMETSRGRWFLGEYAKRNRNADTSMVLDAVARIEATLAAQTKPVRDPLLDEALASFRAALMEAQAAATAALDDLALEQSLAPVRKGARVIREIAWRLREIGADSRICDLIDSQVAAIEGASANVDLAGLAAALNGAFDRIEGKIAAFDGNDAAVSSPSAAAVAQAETTAGDKEPAEAGKTVQASPAAEAEIAATGRASVDEPSAEMAESEPIDTFDANDEAMLDMVAMEMAAPDTDAAYDPIEDAESDETQVNGAQILEAQLDEAHVHERQIDTPQAGKTRANAASYEIDITFASEAHEAAKEPAAASAVPAVTPLQPAPEPVPEAKPEPMPSLGSSLLANGIVSRPRSSRPDPLAPIRRMSQNEKIAFFS